MRRWTFGAVMVLVCVGAWMLRPRPLAPTPMTEAQPKPRVGLAPSSDEVSGASPLAAKPVPRSWDHTEVTVHCDLDLHRVCGNDRCVSATTSADLDHWSGWLQTAWERPRFAMSTVARDLGFSANSLGCSEVLTDLPAVVAALELADGTEIWCAADPPFDAASRTLCDRAASELVPGSEGFSNPHVRILSFSGGAR